MRTQGGMTTTLNGQMPENKSDHSACSMSYKQVIQHSLDNTTTQSQKVENIATSSGRPQWASLFKSNVAPEFKLSFIKDMRQEGATVFKLPKALAVEGSRGWEGTLVGYFIGKKLPYSLIKNISAKMWGKAGLMDMLATESGHFFFKFNSKEESVAVLEGGPWHFAGQPMILRSWQPGIKLEKEAPSKIPIWVNVYNIPMEYWNPEGLSHIASIIGKPLHVDKLTASGRRITFARMCIEVDAKFELLKNLMIEVEDPVSGELDQIDLPVEYQWNPIRCAKCKKFGHDCDRIQKNHVGVKKKEDRPDTQMQDGKWLIKNKGKAVVDINQAYVDETPQSMQGPEHQIPRKGQVITTHEKSLHSNKFSILEEISEEGLPQAIGEGLESNKADKGAHLQDPNLNADSLASPNAPQASSHTTTIGTPKEREPQLPYSNCKSAWPEKQISIASGNGTQVADDQPESRKGNTSPLRIRNLLGLVST